MNVFMIARGSQGDVFPYLCAAEELMRRGHHVAINLPTAFKEHAERIGVEYYLQTEEDIKEIMDDKLEDTDAVKWIGRLMDHQCSWLPKVLKDYDILVSANTEMAAPTLAEYFNITAHTHGVRPYYPKQAHPSSADSFPCSSPYIHPKLLLVPYPYRGIPFAEAYHQP